MAVVSKHEEDIVPKMDEVTGEWGRLQKEGLHMYFSPNSIRVIKSKRMKWAGHTGEVHTGFWWRDLREKDNLGEGNIKMDF